jgi:hypothetical protein
MNNKYCYQCGEEEPRFEVEGYTRNCLECGGVGCVLEVNEMIDLVNDLFLRGLLSDSLVEDVVTEDYNVPELDFDNDNVRLEFGDFGLEDNCDD